MAELPRQLLLDPAFAPRDRPRQLPLDLALAPQYGAEQFRVSACNAAAHAMIGLWPGWPDKALLLTGPAGSGKTHLLRIWAERAGARVVRGADLAAADAGALSRAGAVAVDDAAGVCRAGAEAPLFHLLNLLRESGRGFLLAARQRPESWGLQTPDLLSRLRLAPGVAIDAPDDALLRAVLAKQLADRQLAVDGDIVEYVALRIPRSLEAARNTVAALDAEALARGSKITRALAARVLEAAGGEGE